MKKTAKGGQVRNWRKRDLARDEASTGLGTLEGLIKEGRDVLAQEVEAQAVEAVPAGQLAFRGRGWGKRGLAGKVEPLAGVPVAVLDDEKVFYALVELAGRYLPADKIHIDETVNAELWHRSRVKWNTESQKPSELEVYYHMKSIRLPVLAHEVGHLETLPALGNLSFYCSNSKNRYHAEVEASRWALAFLKSRGLKGKAYVEAVNLLQGCLDNYKNELAVPVRYVLDYSVENQKKGDC